jgi:hypothetical protein
LLYAAYRLELLSPDGSRDIAPELESTTLDGGATFDEFLKYIQLSNAINKIPESTSAGNNLIPDIVQVTKELSEADYRSNYDLQKLFQRGRFTKLRIGWSKIEDAAVSRIQTVRQLLGDEPIQDLLELGRDAIIGLFQESQIWEGPAVMRALADYLGYQPAKATGTALDGSPFEGVDGDATEQQHPGFYDQYDAFMEMISNAPNGPLQGVRASVGNLKFIMELDGRIQGSCTN